MAILFIFLSGVGGLLLGFRAGRSIFERKLSDAKVKTLEMCSTETIDLLNDMKFVPKTKEEVEKLTSEDMQKEMDKVFNRRLQIGILKGRTELIEELSK